MRWSRRRERWRSYYRHGVKGDGRTRETHALSKSMILVMGFTSNVKNRIDGKKYLISTAEDKKGGWQTAVLRHRLFGIPDLLHPAMFIGAPDEEYARQVHARVEKIVAELPLSKWESAKWKLFEEILDNAFPEADVNADDDQGTTLTVAERSRFFSRLSPDAESRLNNEAKNQDSLVIVLAALIIRIALDDTVNEFELIDPEDKQPSDERKGLFAFEQMAFALHCIGRFAFTDETVKQREAFMDDLVFAVSAWLWQIAAFDVAGDRFGRFFATEYNQRADEYAEYSWNDVKDGPVANEVGWQYGKKLLKIVAPEKDALKVAALGNIALRSVARQIPLAQEVIEKYEQD